MVSIPDQVACVGLKRYKTAIQADAWVKAGAITGVTCRIFADTLGGCRRPVVQINLMSKMSSGHKVISRRTKDHKTTIRADICLKAQAIPCLNGIVDAYDLRRSRLTIAYVDLIR